MVNKRYFRICLASFVSCFALNAQAYCTQPHVILDLGGFYAHQGEAQHLGITGLIGDQFSVTQQNDTKGLVGLGYYLDGYFYGYSLLYGINAFYLAPAAVKGNVTQENLFTNLSYEYSITHMPIYLAAKMKFNVSNFAYPIMVNGGVGVNFIQTNDFNEHSLDGGITLPDRNFSGQTNRVLSFMLGVGMQFNFVNCLPMELGYRFFYLGSGLVDGGPQATNLSTGNTYANALTLSVSIL